MLIIAAISINGGHPQRLVYGVDRFVVVAAINVVVVVVVHLRSINSTPS